MRPLPIEPQFRIFVNGDYVDISEDVRQTPAPRITHGSKDEQSRPTASSCTLVLNDPNGDYNRRNPLGAYFGSLTKGTRLDARVPLVIDDRAQTVSNGWGGADPTGTLVPDSWTNNTSGSSGGTVAATNWSRSGTVKTHSLPAAPAVRVSDLGPTQWIDCEIRGSVHLPTADVAGAAVASTIKFRTLDNSNYIGVQLIFRTNETVGIGIIEKIAGVDRVLQTDTTVPDLSVATDQTFVFAAHVEGPVVRAKIWASGDPEPLDWQAVATRATVRAGTTGIRSEVASGNSNTKPYLITYDSYSVSMPVFVGAIAELNRAADDSSNNSRRVDVVAMSVQHGLEQGSSPLKSPLYRTLSATAGWLRESFAESVAGVGDVNTFTCTSAEASNIDVGHFGRITAASPGIGALKEDQLFTVTSKVTAGSNVDVNLSPDALVPLAVGDLMNFYRFAQPADLPMCYWPCEDSEGAKTIASGLPGGTPMTIAYATPDFGSSNAVLGSAPLLKFNNAELTAYAPNYVDTNQAFSIHFVIEMPETDEPAAGQDVVQWQTTGTGKSWDLQYEGSNQLRLTVFDASNSIVFNDVWPALLKGNGLQVIPVCRQSGPSTVTFDLITCLHIGEGTYGGGSAIGSPVTVTGVTTLGKVTRIRANPGAGYVDCGFGHLAAFPRAVGLFNYLDAYGGFIGEGAARRASRLGREEGVQVTYCQGPNPGSQLGAQGQGTYLDAMFELADLDLGQMFGARGAHELVYLSRSALYKVAPVLQLNYAAGQLIEGGSVDDDAQVCNDFTASRQGGSSAQFVLETGPLSTSDYVGRRDDAKTLNAFSDSVLADQAEWRVHLGTVDEDRWPTITVGPATGDVPLERLFSVGVGARITIDNVVSEGIYDQVSQLAMGFTLTLNPFAPTWQINCVPESPYHVFELDSDRLDSDDTTLNEDLTTVETGADIAVAAGSAPWSDADQPYGMKIGGERTTLTDVTGSTLTLTRSVNGVVKTHATGDQVRLADPGYLGL